MSSRKALKTVGVLACLLIPVPGIGVCSAVDLMIVESVVPYRVLNKYEQPLSRQDKNGFPPNVPFVIVDRDATLGDQLTPAMVVTHNGTRYFFQKDADDGLIGASTGEYRRVFHQVAQTGDTVQLRQNATLYTRYPQSGDKYLVRDEKTLVRLFTTNGYYYAHPAADPSRYGWVRLGRNDWTEPSPGETGEAPPKSGIHESVRRRINGHIEKSNTIYRKYFSALNELTPRNKAVPQWTVLEERDGGMTFALSGGPDIITSLEESSRILAEELANILLAEQFTAHYRDGAIRVHRRNGSMGAR